MNNRWNATKTAAIAGFTFAALEAAGVWLWPAPMDPIPSHLVMGLSVVSITVLLGSAAWILSGVTTRYAAPLVLAAWASVWGPHQARLAGTERVGWLPSMVLFASSSLVPGLTVVAGAMGGLVGPALRSRGEAEGRLAVNRTDARPGEMPNILMVTVDTVRADAGLLDGGRWTVDSPFSPVRGWTHFTKAVAPAPWTLPSIHSIMTSLPVRYHGGGLRTETGVSRRVGDTFPLPYLLQQGGYETTAVVSNPHISPEHGLADGFDQWFHSDRSVEPLVLMYQWTRWNERMSGRATEVRHTRDERIITHALKEIRRPSDRPRFVWVHLLGPHEYARDPATEIVGWTPDTERRDVLEAAYAANIDAARANLERLVAAAPGWVIAVTSDHGEAFGEKGRWGHGKSLQDAELRVPLAIRRPGAGGGIVDEPVAVADLGHTLLAYAGRARHFPGQHLHRPRTEPIEVGGVRRDSEAFAVRMGEDQYVAREGSLTGSTAYLSDASREAIRSLGYID